MNPYVHFLLAMLVIVQAMLIAVFLYGVIFERDTSKS